MTRRWPSHIKVGTNKYTRKSLRSVGFLCWEGALLFNGSSNSRARLALGEVATLWPRQSCAADSTHGGLNISLLQIRHFLNAARSSSSYLILSPVGKQNPTVAPLRVQHISNQHHSTPPPGERVAWHMKSGMIRWNLQPHTRQHISIAHDGPKHHQSRFC